MPGVTISSGYGAAGLAVATRVSDLLGLQLLDRAISSAVAAELNVSVKEAEHGAANRSVVERLLSFMSPLANDALATPMDVDPSTLPGLSDLATEFRDEAARIMGTAIQGGAVILGRAGAAAFRDAKDVLRVRLFGPTEARLVRAMNLEHLDHDAARKRMQEVDHARDQYVRRLYHVSVDDPDLFQMQLDSTAIPLEACAQAIATAYRAYVTDERHALTHVAR